jgi:hypothetical protein
MKIIELGLGGEELNNYTGMSKESDVFFCLFLLERR